jgi:hypothetical protein
MYFFIVFSEVALRAAKSVKRDTVQFVFGTRSFPPTFLILKLFIRCLLVGVREGLWVGICLSYKWIRSKLAYFLEESSISMNFLNLKLYIYIYMDALSHRVVPHALVRASSWDINTSVSRI